MAVLYNQPRQTGKTTNMIKKAIEEKLLILTPNHAMAEYVFKEMLKYGKEHGIEHGIYEYVKPMSFKHYLDSVKKKKPVQKSNGIIIEDFDFCMRSIIPKNIVAYTTSMRQENVPDFNNIKYYNDEMLTPEDHERICPYIQ